MITPPSRRRLGGWVPVLWFYNLWFLKLLGATTPCDWVQHAKHAAHVRHSFISQYMDNTKRQETIFHHCCMTHSVAYWDPSDPREGPLQIQWISWESLQNLTILGLEILCCDFQGQNGQQLSKMHVRSSTKGIHFKEWVIMDSWTRWIWLDQHIQNCLVLLVSLVTVASGQEGLTACRANVQRLKTGPWHEGNECVGWCTYKKPK